MRRSFAFKLAAAFAGVGIGAAAITAILVNLAFGARFTSYLDTQRGAHQQQVLLALQDSYSRSGGWSLTDLQGLTSLALMDGGTLQLLDAQGKLVWDASTGPGAAMSQMHRAMMGAGPLGPSHAAPVVVGGARVGTAMIRLPAPGLLPQDRAFRSSVNRLLLIGGVIAGVFALGFGVVLARRAVRPARELTDAARAAAEGDWSLRLDASSADEFGDMARAFNRMADAIDEEDRLRRAFSADVAHELRTPLMILRSQIEGMQDGIVDLGAEAMGSLHEETLRMGRLVSDLETLASAEAAGFSLKPTPTDLAVLAEQAAREFARFADERSVHLRTELTSVVLPVDATRIHQVIANLLSNAIKFTPPNGTVTLAVICEGGRARIRVTDTGPGIPPEERLRVFDRFFRGGNVRAGGSGIGLTVARQLMLAHGGELEAMAPPEGGASFEASLPLTSQLPHGRFTVPSQRPATFGAKGGTR